jgi:dihydrofolate reductase
MRKLVEVTYISLDGMVDSGDEYWVAHGPYTEDKHVAHAAKLLEPATALVLGRVTYESFAEVWAPQTGVLADKLNALPKYVASRTLTDTTWNAEILQGDAVEAVARLKESGEGTLLKYGTGSFSQALLEGGVLDELHLWVFPFVVGSGQSLFSGLALTHMNLVEVTDLGNGCVVLTYTPKQ